MPIINGKLAQGLILSQLLHVPMLQNNLLVVLCLTTHHNFVVNIVKDHISFIQDGNLHFCATVQNEMGFLTGDMIPVPEFALTTSLPAVNQLLLHKWLAHIGSECLERLLANGMAKGMSVSSNEKIPQICEPYIFKSSYLLSQDHTEVNLCGIAARYIVMVVNKKIWESLCDSHAVTIQWVHMVVDPLLPI